MDITRTARRQPGFTLIELLIVIVVIAILALIVIPRLLSAGRRAREATLKANLHILRTALTQFQADTGVYPSSLSDLMLSRTAPPSTGIDDLGNTGVTIPVATYMGPYLRPDNAGINNTGIPPNPFVTPDMTGYATVSNHWVYPISGSPGVIHPAGPTGVNGEGVPFTAL